MAFSLVFTQAAKKDVRALPREAFLFIDPIFIKLQEDPQCVVSRSRKLEVPFAGYRVRKGDYRILFEIAEEEITVYRVRHRKDAYR